MGKPNKWNEHIANAIIRLTEKAMPRELVCKSVGITTETLRKWRREGESEDAPEDKKKFAEEYLRAELKSVERLLDVIINAAEVDGDWKAAMTLLERRLPQYFARRDPGAEEIRGQMMELQNQLLAALTANQPIPATVRKAIEAKGGEEDGSDAESED